MAKVKSKKKNPMASQIFALIGVLIFLVIVSVVTMLIATGTVEVSTPQGPPISYVSDAEAVCGKRVRQDQGAALSSMAVDDHSSYFDEKNNRFKLFYEVEVFNGSDKQSGVKRLFVNCVVASSNSAISRMEYLEEGEFKPKAIRREHGNAFGF